MTGDEAGGGMMAGLVVEDDGGRYFLIPWADLLRFRVPEAYGDVVTALVSGDEAPRGGSGHASATTNRHPASEHRGMWDRSFIARAQVPGRLCYGASVVVIRRWSRPVPVPPRSLHPATTRGPLPTPS
jgi:hypothetical protein